MVVHFLFTTIHFSPEFFVGLVFIKIWLFHEIIPQARAP